MNRKKVFKIIAWVFAIIALIIFSIITYGYYMFKYSLTPKTEPFKHSSHYIDPGKSLLNEDFKICNEKYILQYYNTDASPYLNGKNNFRNHINSNYTNRNYTDSGYLNIRFIINCKGEAGRFIIHENNLDLEPNTFNEDLKNQLVKITTEIKQWSPLFLYEESRDSYMYVSYRIEHGEITEIIP